MHSGRHSVKFCDWSLSMTDWSAICPILLSYFTSTQRFKAVKVSQAWCLSLTGEIASVDEASARATQQAMQATAEAVAKLQLQSRAAATKPAANSGIVDAHVLQQQSGATGNGVAPDLATTPAMPNQPLLPSLQPADSGYLADTEGQPMR